MTLGFVNRCFKAPTPRSVEADEYVHLLSRSKSHYKANIEDVLRQIEGEKANPTATAQETIKRIIPEYT